MTCNNLQSPKTCFNFTTFSTVSTVFIVDSTFSSVSVVDFVQVKVCWDSMSHENQIEIVDALFQKYSYSTNRCFDLV